MLMRTGPLAQPVTLAQRLAELGLGLRQAHSLLNRLAADEPVAITFPAVPDPAAVVSDLAALGLRVEWRCAPAHVDVKAIRERLDLTQAAFAARFGLELDSVRNWEQGRYTPDPVARILLKIIEQSPETVDRVVAA
ncbi:helix-turn-helix domain-containing protein [Niveispirillum irakense]|uniref:helix-turn-helix domain-containing protein n=1 Tax=Niveispirillum irakense TaxID=34011 RepID=UPI0004130359|nr:helix-turn-helix domain-containing protein [Niveispirillum irakense]